MEQVLCKDCKHAKWRPWYILSYRCMKVLMPEVVKTDLVTGPKVTPAHYESCFSQRFDGEGKCGKVGKFWEPKNKKGLFKLIKHMENV